MARIRQLPSRFAAGNAGPNRLPRACTLHADAEECPVIVGAVHECPVQSNAASGTPFRSGTAYARHMPIQAAAPSAERPPGAARFREFPMPRCRSRFLACIECAGSLRCLDHGEDAAMEGTCRAPRRRIPAAQAGGASWFTIRAPVRGDDDLAQSTREGSMQLGMLPARVAGGDISRGPWA